MQKKKDNFAGPSVRVRTLGCKVNFCDGRALLDALTAAGLPTRTGGLPADIEVVNTCAVTARSVQKARSLIRRLRKANPAPSIIVTGCAARVPEDAFSKVPEADAICPFPRDVIAWLARRYGIPVTELPPGSLDFDRTRAFVKIQDGCQAGCAYCVVPAARGVQKSLEASEALRLVTEAVERGYHEVVICGIHLGQYGRDLGGTSLVDIMRAIAGIRGRFRVRLSSIEPLEVTDALLEVMGAGERFCPHLHLPLQSGSDKILKAMGRPYGAGEYFEVLERARRFLNNPAITTDIMVGFPGETPEDHRLTVEAIRKAGFARAHVFMFSARPGTRAALMPDRVAGREARRRSLEARCAGSESARTFRRTLTGTVAQVVVESVEDNLAEGLCRRYQRVRFRLNAGPVSSPARRGRDAVGTGEPNAGKSRRPARKGGRGGEEMRSGGPCRYGTGRWQKPDGAGKQGQLWDRTVDVCIIGEAGNGILEGRLLE